MGSLSNPASDQGYLIVTVQTPADSSLTRANAALRGVVDIAAGIEGGSLVHEITGLAPLTDMASNPSVLVFVLLPSIQQQSDTFRPLTAVQPALQAAVTA